MIKLAAIIFSFVLLGVSNAYSQFVNGIPVNEIETEYIEIVGFVKLFKGKITIHMDYGQEDKSLSRLGAQLTDKNGFDLEFNSMVDALNFFSKNGYDVLNTYPPTDKVSLPYYLLRKKKE